MRKLFGNGYSLFLADCHDVLADLHKSGLVLDCAH